MKSHDRLHFKGTRHIEEAEEAICTGEMFFECFIICKIGKKYI